MKRTISILLLMSLLLSATACGDTETGSDDTTGGDTTPAVTTEADPYDYPELDLEGREFTFLSPAKYPDMWQMHTDMDFETQTGEPLDDALYSRNIALEERYNFTISEKAMPSGDYYTIQNTLRADVMSGDGAYDAAFICGQYVGSIMTDGTILNLRELDGFNFEEDWWNQATVQASTFGDNELYFAQGDLSLSAFDLTWMLMFNESKMEELKLDKPYDLVREGKWTVDKLWEYAKSYANLNGDASFEVTEDGNATYGYTTYYNGALAAMIGAGVQFTKNDKDGVPTLNIENERFYNVCDKLASLYGSEGDFVEGTTGGVDDYKGYYGIYTRGKALFLGCEVKSTNVFRDVEDDFGVLPHPKLDENQEQYYSWTNFLAPVLVVPSTTKFADEVGYLLDTMSYMSHRDVLPIYYEVTLNQKGLRNEDSIEMMDYIRDSLYFDASMAYGWTESLSSGICKMVVSGDGAVASTVAGQKTAVETRIKTMMDDVSK